jgi:hypothetical protein
MFKFIANFKIIIIICNILIHEFGKKIVIEFMYEIWKLKITHH